MCPQAWSPPRIKSKSKTESELVNLLSGGHLRIDTSIEIGDRDHNETFPKDIKSNLDPSFSSKSPKLSS